LEIIGGGDDATIKLSGRMYLSRLRASLLAEIEYRAKSAEGKLRHPFFKGIREDL